MARLYTLKVFLISTILLFTATRFQEAFITNFVIKHIFLMWNFFLSCFKPRPPYLFLLFNSIIISISASTIFHHRSRPSLPSAYVAKPMHLSEEEEEEEEDPTLENTDILSEPSMEEVWKGIKRSDRETALQKHDKVNERMCSMRIEPTPSLDELNRRADAFIRKFKEEIRLQKLHSLSKSKHEDDDEKSEKIFFYN